MQLTKDDLITDLNLKKMYIDYSKFQRVVEFYVKHRMFSPSHHYCLDELYKNYREVHDEWLKIEQTLFKGPTYTWNWDQYLITYNEWLFNYCFKDGLK